MRRLLHRRTFDIAGRLGECDSRETIVIAGSPRSGTTLLFEVLALLPGHKGLNEPLIHRRTQRAHGFVPRTFMAPGTVHPAREAFLDGVLRGRVGVEGRWAFSAQPRPLQVLEHARKRRLVVKFCRLNRMLPWFAQRFDTRGTILVVRHPCAVVASMLRFGQWDKDWNDRKHRPDSSLYLRHLPDPIRDTFQPVFERVKSQAEALAFIWGLDQYVPLIHETGDQPWLVVPYERLVLEREAELGRIASFLDIDLSPEMIEASRTPSSSTLGTLPPDPRRQLSRWEDHLTAAQIDSILSIVEDVGLSTFYHRALEPSYEAFERTRVASER